MTHAAKTAPEADEKMIERLRDAMTFDQRGLELLGPETTRRLAFAVCNKLGLIPRSTEQAEVFLNAMRAAGQLSVADVNSAKWDLLGEEHSAGHTFAPDELHETRRGRVFSPEDFDSPLARASYEHARATRDLTLQDGLQSIPVANEHDEADDQEVSAAAGSVAHFEKYLLEAAKELRKIDRPWLASRCYRAAREIEELTLEIIRLKGFEEAFLSTLSSLNHLGDSLHGRGALDED